MSSNSSKWANKRIIGQKYHPLSPANICISLSNYTKNALSKIISYNDYIAVIPPSTISTEPVVKTESSDANQSIARAISCGWGK